MLFSLYNTLTTHWRHNGHLLAWKDFELGVSSGPFATKGFFRDPERPQLRCWLVWLGGFPSRRAWIESSLESQAPRHVRLAALAIVLLRAAAAVNPQSRALLWVRGSSVLAYKAKTPLPICVQPLRAIQRFLEIEHRSTTRARFAYPFLSFVDDQKSNEHTVFRPFQQTGKRTLVVFGFQPFRLKPQAFAPTLDLLGRCPFNKKN